MVIRGLIFDVDGLILDGVPNPLTCQQPLGHAGLRLASLAGMPLEVLLTAVQTCTKPVMAS